MLTLKMYIQYDQILIIKAQKSVTAASDKEIQHTSVIE